MKKQLIITLLFAAVAFGCEKDFAPPNTNSVISANSPYERDVELLELLEQEIRDAAAQCSCEGAEEWYFAGVGQKACGGPWEYIAYSSQIDTTYFLKLIEHLKTQEEIYNMKRGIYSTCVTPPMPEYVICVDGKPQFMYK